MKIPPPGQRFDFSPTEDEHRPHPRSLPALLRGTGVALAILAPVGLLGALSRRAGLSVPRPATRLDLAEPAATVQARRGPTIPGSIENRLTLAMPNHARSSNVREIVAAAVQYDCIDEVLIWDDPAQPHDSVNFTDPKVTLIRAPELHPMQRWGMLGRFKFALLARNEQVLIQDDDQFLQPTAIERMLQARAEDEDRLVCYFGREIANPDGGDALHYELVDPPAPLRVPICLTKVLLTDRRFLLRAVQYAPLMEDLAMTAHPYWNGEDIWHSLTAFQATGKLHTLLSIDRDTYRVLSERDGIGDLRTYEDGFNHANYRAEFVRAAVPRLNLTAQALVRQPYEVASNAN